MHREILRLAIPNILSNISVPLLSTFDTALMGRLSAEHLGAVGLGADVAAARDRAYALLADVRFAGMNHRRDIGAAFLGE